MVIDLASTFVKIATINMQVNLKKTFFFFNEKTGGLKKYRKRNERFGNLSDNMK